MVMTAATGVAPVTPPSIFKTLIKQAKKGSWPQPVVHISSFTSKRRQPPQPDNTITVNVMNHLYSLLSTTVIHDVDTRAECYSKSSDEMGSEDEPESRTELDSHTNMPVVAQM